MKSVAGKLTDTCFSASSNLGLIQISNITAWAAREKIDVLILYIFLKCIKYIDLSRVKSPLYFSARALDIQPIMTGDRDT